MEKQNLNDLQLHFDKVRRSVFRTLSSLLLVIIILCLIPFSVEILSNGNNVIVLLIGSCVVISVILFFFSLLIQKFDPFNTETICKNLREEVENETERYSELKDYWETHKNTTIPQFVSFLNTLYNTPEGQNFLDFLNDVSEEEIENNVDAALLSCLEEEKFNLTLAGINEEIEQKELEIKFYSEVPDDTFWKYVKTYKWLPFRKA